MSKTIRHRDPIQYKESREINSQYMPQNRPSKEYYKRIHYIPFIGGGAYNGHKPRKDNRIYSGILRAKMKEEINLEIQQDLLCEQKQEKEKFHIQHI